MTIDKNKILQLKGRWLNLLADSGDPEHLSPWFDEIVSRYSEPHRAYHTLEHISACLVHLDKVAIHLKQPLEVELAMWLHDIIYLPKRTDNEYQSAIYARERLTSTQLTAGQIERVVHLICLTQHPATPNDMDESYLLDIDLSIFGTTDEVFDEYEKNIRREYAHVPEFFYRRGRKKILTQFLNSRHLFVTQYFSDQLANRARTNLQRALASL